jgi:hypothetical protein
MARKRAASDLDETWWLHCADPDAMLVFVRDRASERQLQLFGCTCCWRTWPALALPASRHAVEVSQRYAVGGASAEELIQTWVQAHLAWNRVRYPDDPEYADEPLPGPDPGWWIDAAEAAACLVECRPITGTYDLYNTWHAVRSAAEAARRATGEVDAEARVQAAFLRCIFGNPFRPLSIDPQLLAASRGVVLPLAQAAYEECPLPPGTLDPDRLAVLADALEESGCSEPAILEHLRSPGSHVRCCHVVALVVGRS